MHHFKVILLNNSGFKTCGQKEVQLEVFEIWEVVIVFLIWTPPPKKNIIRTSWNVCGKQLELGKIAYILNF